MHTYTTIKLSAHDSRLRNCAAVLPMAPGGTFSGTGIIRCALWTALALVGVTGKAADIDFSPPATITGNASDVLAHGTNLYAYAWNGTTGQVTVNGVSFKLTNQKNTNIDGNLSVTHGGYTGPASRAARWTRRPPLSARRCLTPP